MFYSNKIEIVGCSWEMVADDSVIFGHVASLCHTIIETAQHHRVSGVFSSSSCFLVSLILQTSDIFLGLMSTFRPKRLESALAFVLLSAS